MYSWQQAAGSENPERHTAQGSGRKAKTLSSITLCLTPYLNSQSAKSSMPHALCFFATDNGRLTTDHRQVIDESQLA